MHFIPPAFLLASGPVPGGIPVSVTLLLVFGAAKLLAEAFEWMGQPGIVGEILAGVLLGPSLLDLVKPDATLHTLAEMGVLFLLFRVGMQMKPSDLIRLGGPATLVAASGVVIPFLAGWAAAIAAGSPSIESIFVGSALVATSLGITAQVLAVKGLLDRKTSRIILAAAVVDDILGLLVLAVAGSSASGEVHWGRLALTGGLSIGFVLAALFLGAPAMRKLAPKLTRTLRTGESELAIAMVALFALAVLAEHAGVAAIVGAFLAGSLFAESASRRIKDICHGTTELLVPFFLVSIGRRVGLREFADGQLLAATLGLIAIAVVSKIVAQMGLSLGALSAPAYSAVLLMAAATTLLAPPLSNLAFRDVQIGPAAEEVLRLG